MLPKAVNVPFLLFTGGFTAGVLQGVKELPTLVLAALCLVAAVFARVAWLRRLVLAGLYLLALWTALYLACVWIAPPVTADGHRVMPMGQVFFASLASTVLWLTSLALYWRRFGRVACAPCEAFDVRALAAVVVVASVVHFYA